MNAKKIISLFLLVVVFLQGCATSSLFLPYPSRAMTYRQALELQNTDKVLAQLDSLRSSRDKVLYLMERGRIAQINGDTAASIEDFQQAIEEWTKFEEKALLSASGTAFQGASLVSNDNAVPYRGEGYERVLVHQFQALNYLAQNDLQAALVEVRRANLEQRVALQDHEKEIARAENKAREKRVQLDPNQFRQYFRAMDETVGKVKSSFQNGYTFYVSGLIYEAAGQLNDAYIDYKKAHEIFPDNRFLQQDLLRLSKKLGMNQDYQTFKKRYGSQDNDLARDQGHLVILLENGFVPAKEEISIPIPTKQGVQAVSFPIYQQPWRQPQALYWTGEGQTVKSEPIVYINALAMKSLSEKIPALLIRQTLRVLAKKEMQNKANDNGNVALAIGTQLYNIVSERADLRSWLTLPNSAQIIRRPLSSGSHNFTLRIGSLQKQVNMEIRPGRINILRVISTGNRLVHQTYNL